MGDSFGFVDDNKPNRLWRAIFKDEAWLQTAIDYGAEPVLIGAHLDEIVAQTGRKQPVYIVLRTNDFSGDTFHDGLEPLRQSLRKRHYYNKRSHEVILPKISWRNGANEKITIPKIILNVRDIVSGAETLVLPGKKIRELFEQTAFTSKYSFFQYRKIQTLESRDIFGIGGTVSGLGALTPICGFNLHTASQKWQVLFAEPNCRNLTPYYEGKKGVPHTILGWRG
ncbi:hypothetical protein BDV25DRAFT_144768 [Aspergillus avenaceus]|uniref:Uncharacterized protein n=1 Tax=Aspergillus avenaceus TaxID=36643 RepID=A0A5N6TG13_ASPAV|nr:hypothetical protein BDV25DRAFT_144768 [Aspergillus avenaceus]